MPSSQHWPNLAGSATSLVFAVAILASCGNANVAPTDGPRNDTPVTVSELGTVDNVMTIACPPGVPTGVTSCQALTVSGCAGIETEAITATVAVATPSGLVKGTVVHFKGGGGQGFEDVGNTDYAGAGLRQVFVSWETEWEQTQSHGLKTAACRPATVIKWVFDTIHGGSRTAALCGQGFSGGSGQVGYALAHYGMGDYLDYVNELSGPPFARIDLGCDGDAPATAMVCGADDTTRLPPKLDRWENNQAPVLCGSTSVPAAELSRWRADSIAVGGTYVYPNTRVEFFECTNNATSVTAMSQMYYDTIVQEDPSRVAFHCYSQQDNCDGEQLGAGFQQASQALIAGCVPRHQ